jgi:hypothetical protein
MKSSAIDRLHALVETGDLRFVYVVGVARSSSTILCRVLGSALDGAVFEPATPVALDRQVHYASTIIRAYNRARKQIGAGRPVTLAIKDLSLFLDDPSFLSIVAQAAHVVFSVRHPVAQQASLKRQLKQEFSPLQRVDAVVRYPFEALWMAWYFLVYGRRFVRDASALLGYGVRRLPRLAMAGWNLQSWRNMEAQIAGLGDMPVTVLDADDLRRDPQAAEALLRSIAAAIAPAGPRASVEMAGHSRMLPRSKWAAEALASRGIKPAMVPGTIPATDAFDAGLLAVTEAAYHRVRRTGADRVVEAAE